MGRCQKVGVKLRQVLWYLVHRKAPQREVLSPWTPLGITGALPTYLPVV